MRRASVLVAAALILIPHDPIRAQAPAGVTSDLAFEVASIKRNISGSGSMSVGMRPGGRFIAVNATPLVLVLNAYPYERYRVIGAPRWTESERYDVTADAGTDITREQLATRLKTLLAERFQLVVHTEVRPLQAYVLVRARSDGQLGPHLRRWDIDCQALRASGGPAPSEPRTIADFAVPPPCRMHGGSGVFAAGGVSLADFTRFLSAQLGAPVTDHTGLDGEYEIVVRWNPDPGGAGSDASLPSLFTAVQEQLGLRLEARREALEVLVIDSIERPSEN